MRGANYVPSYARNDVAIWMDYDPAVIDRELGYAERLRLNTVRVFLNQAVYEHAPQQFLQRLESFLSLCDKHRIRAMPVLFDSCFDPQMVDLKDYRQRNWMPSPGFSRLGAKDRPAMEDYLHAVVGGHKDDRRIVLWDVMNEPESIAAVAIDGSPAPVAEIDTYAKDVDWNRRTTVARDLPPGPHTVVITATGRQAAGSTFRYVQVVDLVGELP